MLNIKSRLNSFVTASLVLSAFLLAFPKSASAFTSGPSGINGLRGYQGPDAGEVTLEWSRVTLTGENYTIWYGTTPGSRQFRAPYVGYISTFTVKSLTPGTRYYFSLERIQTGNVSIGTSGEVSVVAPSGKTSPTIVSGPVGRNSTVAVKGPKSGEVTLSWKRYFPDSDGWHVVYGTKPGVWSYGALNAVKATSAVSDYSYTVKGLSSGVRYYFAIVPVRGGNAQYISSEVSQVAK